jgi:hypothetical protein
MNAGLFLIIIPLAIVIAAAYFVTAYAVRRRQLRHLRTMARGAYVFTFNSSGWYQTALLDLQKHEIIESKALTDDSNPVTRGPRWASVTSEGIRIMHGYDEEPTVVLPWSLIGDVKEGSRTHGTGRYSSTAEGVCIGIHLDDRDIVLLLDAPNPTANPWTSAKLLSPVIDELNWLRTAPPSAKLL